MTMSAPYTDSAGEIDTPVLSRVEPSLDARPRRGVRLWRRASHCFLVCVGFAWFLCVVLGLAADWLLTLPRRFEEAVESIDDPKPYLVKMERFSARVFVVASVLLFMLVAFCLALLAIERVAVHAAHF